LLHLLQTSKEADRCIELIIGEIGTSSLRGRHCTVLAVTCYIDFDAVTKLLGRVTRALGDVGAILEQITLLYDVREWAKQRTDAEGAAHAKVVKRTALDPKKVTFLAAAFPDRLMHSKAYAVISRPGGTTRNRKGFVVTTSANLTRRGMGLEDEGNVELAHVSRDPQDLEQMLAIAKQLEHSVVSPKKRLKQDEFIFAIRLLTAGTFYHQWQGNLTAEVRFKLRLTDVGRRLGIREQGPLRRRGYETSTDSVSRDPLDIGTVFQRVPKPIPREFLRMFSVDTLLGRWIPLRIADVVDAKLTKEVQPYLDELRSLTSPAKLRQICEQLRKDVDDLSKDGLVEGTGALVMRWRKRIEDLRDNDALLNRIVFNLEALYEPFAELDRRLIMDTYESLKQSVEMKGTRGELKRILAEAFSGRPLDCERLFDDLVDDARSRL
jgi:hypothetical protein